MSRAALFFGFDFFAVGLAFCFCAVAEGFLFGVRVRFDLLLEQSVGAYFFDFCWWRGLWFWVDGFEAYLVEVFDYRDCCHLFGIFEMVLPDCILGNRNFCRFNIRLFSFIGPCRQNVREIRTIDNCIHCF